MGRFSLDHTQLKNRLATLFITTLLLAGIELYIFYSKT